MPRKRKNTDSGTSAIAARIALITGLQSTLTQLLDSHDFGFATESLDRASDQLGYALDELEEQKDKSEFGNIDDSDVGVVDDL